MRPQDQITDGKKAKTPPTSEGVLGCGCVSGGALTSGSTASSISLRCLYGASTQGSSCPASTQIHRQKGFPSREFTLGAYPYLVTVSCLSLRCATRKAAVFLHRSSLPQHVANRVLTRHFRLVTLRSRRPSRCGSVNHCDAPRPVPVSNYQTLNVFRLVDSNRLPCKEHRHGSDRDPEPVLLN
jgi:hypothetical protein